MTDKHTSNEDQNMDEGMKIHGDLTKEKETSIK
jgi:hypothetical protein